MIPKDSGAPIAFGLAALSGFLVGIAWMALLWWLW